MKEILIKKYMAGTSTRQDEQELRRLLQEEQQSNPENQALLMMLEMQPCDLKAEAAWLEEDDSELFDSLMEEQAEAETPLQALPQQETLPLKLPPRHLRRIMVRVMAAAAILCGAFYASRTLWQTESTNEAVTYIYGNKVEDSRVAMDMMQETMGDLFDRPDLESELTDIFN